MLTGRARRTWRERIFAKTFASAFALASVTAANAEDLSWDGLKDVSIPSVTAAGVTIFGTIDVGYGYQTHGEAFSGAQYVGEDYNIFGAGRFNTNPWSGLTNNALAQSFIGVKVEEKLYDNWVAIGRLDTGFNPMSGELSDACASLVRQANQVAFGGRVEVGIDGSRCGQAFNGQAYGGVSNSTYGTLTFGRQNSLVLDGMAVYDPMALSYALSMLGWSGSLGPGVGSTETARWDTSVKYIFQYGPAHAAGMYASGAEDSSIHGSAAAGNIGVTWQGFSIDGYYTRENGAINAPAAATPGTTYNLPPGTAGGLNRTLLLTSPNVNSLLFYVTDNAAWDVMAKYTFQLYDCCAICCSGGSLKDNPEPSAKLTLYGGYQHVDLTNPGGGALPGQYTSTDLNGTTIGGYVLAVPVLSLISTRVIQTTWGGVKYESGPWVLAGAYYRFWQNNFSENNFVGGNGHTLSIGGCPPVGVTPAAGTFNRSTCAGAIDNASFLVDYIFNKNFDVYAGVMWSDIGGGLAFSSVSNGGFFDKNNTSIVSGLRVNF